MAGLLWARGGSTSGSPQAANGFWLYFWMAMLIGAGAVFAGITLLVAWKGGGEIVRMFRRSRPER